ncbi:TVP38/TMEM64 family protein [Desulfuribacillus alkaliarsenatis]|uniref:TVP38/TMEM64 family membrane protein n=1 Tax=Desulfuribacillus alkaliarsenatis TaxID=766136 RepID=A0A1E5FZH2_9FIRM|nr:TVP38/TMEM64 family protein [Desulfuribacillus alkaliarsenatis]OEF95848.1 hypothetical protein BHF68_10655 [Desulfuribacillus alkaliarsenatis]
MAATASKKPLYLVLAFIIGIMVISSLQETYEHLTPEVLQGWVLSFGWYAPLVFLLLALIRPLVFFPITIYYLASGLAFGPLWGGVIALTGASISALVAYSIVYKTGTSFLSDKWIGRITYIKGRINNRGFRNILLIRLIPMLSFDLVSYAGGLAGIRMKTFLLATILGVTPRIFAYSYLGANVLDVGSQQFWIAIAVFLIIILASVLLAKAYQNRAKSDYNFK